jgi:hypothetical protein
MVGPQIKLNDAQLAVLRWVAEGSPEKVMEGYAHRLSAAALRSRGLVKISGRGPAWRARITPEGESFLNGISDTGIVKADSAASHKQRKSPSSASRAKPPKKEIPKLVLPKDLRGAHPLVIATRDAARGLEAGDDGRLWLGPRSGVAHLVLSPSFLRRALLVLHALTRESIKRGWDVVSYSETRYRARPGIAIEVRGRAYPVEIHELMESLPFTEADIAAWRTEVQWQYELERRADRMPSAALKPKRATGRLRLLLPTGLGEGRSGWADGPSGSIESKLPSVLRALDERANARERKAMEHARRAEEHRREREAEQEHARRADIENVRVERLLAEVEAWQMSATIRAYVAGVERKLADLKGEERSRIAEWCRWAKDWADQSDPSRNTSLIAGLEEDEEDH